MLGKRTRPVVIGKLPDSFKSGTRFGYPETITSPKCSLEFRILSPRSLKSSDPAVGIGLGIVAALEKSGGDVPMKNMVGGSSSSPTPSDPIPINGTTKAYTKCKKGHPQEPESDVECMDESYTCVTSHRPNKSINKMYCDEGEDGGAGHDRSGCDDMRWKNPGVFYESRPKIVEAKRVFPMLDFLSSCYMCGKILHGRDIYMYRGEKAFCSVECRCKQIAIDERKEKCGSEVSRSLDVSNSPYSRENIFFTGIVAA